MPAKKGSKYLNAKTSSILSQYNPEDIQELLNSGEFKSDTPITFRGYSERIKLSLGYYIIKGWYPKITKVYN